MPAYQTTYAGTLSPGYEGMIANMEVTNIISRTIETAGGVGFGKGVFQGATDQAVATTGSSFRGVTVVDHNVRPTAAGTDGYAQGDTVSIMTKGVIWVLPTSNVTPGAPAYVTPAGAFSATATSNTAIPGGYFDSTATSGSLAKLRIGVL